MGGSGDGQPPMKRLKQTKLPFTSIQKLEVSQKEENKDKLVKETRKVLEKTGQIEIRSVADYSRRMKKSKKTKKEEKEKKQENGKVKQSSVLPVEETKVVHGLRKETIGPPSTLPVAPIHIHPKSSRRVTSTLLTGEEYEMRQNLRPCVEPPVFNFCYPIKPIAASIATLSKVPSLRKTDGHESTLVIRRKIRPTTVCKRVGTISVGNVPINFP